MSPSVILKFVFGPLLILVLGIGLLICAMIHNAAYRQGQIDAMEGRWKYQPATQRVYEEVPSKG